MNPLDTPATLTREQVRTASNAQALSPLSEMARDMYDGWHLGRPDGHGSQGTEYWSGPMVAIDTTLPAAQQAQLMRARGEFLTALRRSFASTNYVKETVQRHVDAVLGHTPTWSTDAGPKADALLSSWWAMQDVQGKLYDWACAALNEGRSVLRFHLSPAALELGVDGLTRIRNLAPETLIRFMRLEILPLERVNVWEDGRGNPAAVQRYRLPGESEDRYEVSYVLDDGNSSTSDLTVISAYDAQGVQSAVSVSLGGIIPYLEYRRPPLTTPQVLENQRAYNVVTTMANRNTELAGFLERYGINLEPPTVDVTAPNGVVQKKSLLRTGPGALTLWFSKLIPREVPNSGGAVNYEPMPSQYGRFEPTSAAPLESALTSAKTNIFSETRQLFALMSSEATASGRSREVAMADFVSSVQATARDMERLGGEVLTLFLRFLGALTGIQNHTTVKASMACRIQPIPPSPLERKENREDVQAGIISVQTAQSRQNIVSPQLEQDLISAEVKAGFSPLARAPVISPSATKPS